MSARVVRCTIEMELVEGDHFNSSLNPQYGTDEQILKWAKNSFLEMISDVLHDDFNIDDYVQVKIVETTT